MKTQDSEITIFKILSFFLILNFAFSFLAYGTAAADYSDVIEKAIAFYEKGDFDKAIREFKQAINGLKDRPEDEARNEGLFTANLYLGMSYLGKGKETLAKESFKNAFKAAPHKTLSSEQHPPKVISLYNEVVAQSLASITVKSNVRNAEVFVDDVKKGAAPVVMRNLLPGQHIVKIIALGQEISKTVDLEAGKEQSVFADFQLAGSVSVISDPPAATVYLDGRPLGATPILIKEVAVGEHMINLSKAGFADLDQKVNVKGNETADVNVRLTPLAFSIKVLSVPDNAEVFWDETSRGATPVTIENITQGMHKVRIVKEGYEEQTDTLDIKTSLTEKSYRLSPHTGSLSIKTEPAGVEVIIDNVNVGTTPVNVSALPVKQYLVRLKKAGHKEKDLTVIIAKDKASEINEIMLETDTQKPEIIHESLAKAVKENKNFIKAKVIDNQAVGDVLLLLKMEGEINFQGLKMTMPLKGMYETIIPESYLKKGATLEYYISACDIQNNCEVSGSKESPYKLKVISLEPYTEGFIIDVDSNKERVTISLGSIDGVKKGEKYVVFRAGKELRNPKTGELLQIEEIFIGTIEVNELMPRTACAGVEETVAQIAKDDRIRKQVSAPSGLMTEGAYAQKIQVRWAPNREPEVKGYHIFKSPKIDGSYKKIGEIHGRDNTHYDDNGELKEGMSFYYKITAFNIFGTDSLMSEPLPGKTKKGVSPPEGIKAEAVKVREVHLKWIAAKQDQDIQKYVIFRADSEAGQFIEIANVSNETETYIDGENLKDGKTYYYKIAGKSIYGSLGELSKTLSVTTKPRPKPPADVNAESGLARRTLLKWEKNKEKDITEYWIYRVTEGRHESLPLAKIKGNNNTFTEADLKDGAKYFYAVKAVDADGLESDFSSTVGAVTKSLPKAPAGLKVNLGQGKALLKWEPNKEPDIRGYNVFKKGWLKNTLLIAMKENSCEIKLEDKAKAIKVFVTAVDKDGLESEPSEEAEINLQ